MSNSLVKINTHLIFHVKSSGIHMRANDLERVFAYIGGTIRNVGGTPIIIGGMPDHIHILCTIPKNISISAFIQNIKAKSSKWIKSIDQYYAKFAWQEGYGAFSVSPSLIDKTINYIRNQQEHHKKRSSLEEFQSFLEAYEIATVHKGL